MSATAAEELQRLMYLFAAAQRPGGAATGELARALDLTAEQVVRLVGKAMARDFYLPAGESQKLQIGVEHDRVRVFTGRGESRDFHRPIRLSQGEAMALGLGLRAMASEALPAERPRILDLASRLEAALASPPAVEFMADMVREERDVVAYDLSMEEETPFMGDVLGSPRFARETPRPPRPPEPPAAVRLVFEPGSPVELETGDDGFRGVLADAARERVKVRLRYVKPGEREPESRLVSPYRIVFAQGAWYVVGHDASRDDVRIFRMDRVLEAEATEERFEVPADFDVAAFLDERGRPYRPGEARETWVRYSPRIARWIVERYGCPLESDGSARVRHVVADPRWVWRHVLSYGGEAVVEGAGSQ